MVNIGDILSSIATLLVSVGAVVVLFKTAALITTLSEKIKEWKE